VLCTVAATETLDCEALQTAIKQSHGIAQLQRQAERDSRQERISQRIDRSIKAFLRDHANSSRREDAMLLLEEVDAVLDESLEADQVRLELQQLRRTHDLTEPKEGIVEDLAGFAAGLSRIRYSAINAVQEEPLDLSSVVSPLTAPADGASVATKESTDGQAVSTKEPVPQVTATA
jgi:hypothetical protein